VHRVVGATNRLLSDDRHAPRLLRKQAPDELARSWRTKGTDQYKRVSAPPLPALRISSVYESFPASLHRRAIAIMPASRLGGPQSSSPNRSRCLGLGRLRGASRPKGQRGMQLTRVSCIRSFSPDRTVAFRAQTPVDDWADDDSRPPNREPYDRDCPACRLQGNDSMRRSRSNAGGDGDDTTNELILAFRTPASWQSSSDACFLRSCRSLPESNLFGAPTTRCHVCCLLVRLTRPDST